MVRKFGGTSNRGLLGLGLLIGLLAALPAHAQTDDPRTGKVDWGIWVDGDGCMHWYADGGFEGYMVPRRNPKTGRAVCLKRHACLAQSTDELFEPGSATLSKEGEAQLRAFFADQEAQAYAVFAHSDGAGGKAAAERLTQAQAAAVADVARSAGAQVTEAVGGGARYPKAAKGSAANRRVELVCYR
jgi:outer membrane protein OmpA-like peptidoglycan-associated protein